MDLRAERENIQKFDPEEKQYCEGLLNEIVQLMKALKLAYEAMNYLGDILNKHDMVQPEDEAATKEAFEVVSKRVGPTSPERKARDGDER